MKLNLNSKELLALHNLLYERFEACYNGKEYHDDDPRASAEAQLKQVYSRLKACIVNSLTGKCVDPFDSWAEKEQQKIDKLNEALDDVKKSSADLANAKVADDPDFFVPLSEENWDMPEYPKRGARPAGNRQGKHHNKR